MSNDFTPQQQALIERLETAPQRRLSIEAKEAIFQRMLAQVGVPPIRDERPRLPNMRFSVPALAAAAIIAISLAGLVLAQYPKAVNPPSSPTGLVTSPTAPSTATGAATPATMVPVTATNPVISPAVAFALDGVVQAVTGNVVTVNQTQITLTATDPILKTIHVGDTVHIEGKVDPAGKLFASAVQINPGGNNGSASVDGIVQAINNNIVTINGVQIQLPADFPGLASITVGTFLSVDGYFRSDGTTMILIVVNVTVVPTAQVPTLEKCRTVQPAMGMAQPDAMGMGVPAPPAMGMAQPDAMGMGEPGMGAASEGCN